jgi:peroxiredoxin
VAKKKAAKKEAQKEAPKEREPEKASKDSPPPWTYAAYGAFVLLAAVLVYSFVTVAREGESRRECSALCLSKPNYAGANLTAPAFTLKDMNGKDVSLASYQGKVVVLNFWASWCAPCREEMPDLGELTHILQPEKDIAIITVSVDSGPDEVRDLLKTLLREEPPFPVLFDPNGDHIVGPKYGTHQFPETWLIDKRGVIRARFDGQRPWSNPIVVEAIEQLRSADYCPVEIKEGQTTGKAAHFCEDPTGT